MKKTEKTGAVSELFGGKKKPGAGGVSGAAQALFSDSEARFGSVPITDIRINSQIRKSSFDGQDSTIVELADNIKSIGVLQPILLREVKGGFELVAGERRVRACTLAGILEIPAFIRVLTDEQAAQAQAAENIHRENLAQFEIAAEVLRKSEQLGGNREAIAAYFVKSKAWVSKMLALTRLSEEAQELANDGISADPEVLVAVSSLSKEDKGAAKKVSEKLRENKGAGKAREVVKEALQEVKAKNGKPVERKKSGPAVATEPDSTAKDPSGGTLVFNSGKVAAIEQRLFGLVRGLDNIAREDTNQMVLEALGTLAEDDIVMLRNAAQESFDLGREQSQTPAVWLRELMLDVVPLDGKKRFVDWQTGSGVVLWLAYSLGATKRATFELSDLLGALR